MASGRPRRLAGRPLGLRRDATATTRPVTGLCNVVDTKPPGVPITCPRRTRSPAFTVGVHGAPVCWFSGST